MNNEQIMQELQSSFVSDYGVSQQLIDNVARLIQENGRLRVELEQEKDKIKELLENETIDISGFRCIAVEDIEELLEVDII